MNLNTHLELRLDLVRAFIAQGKLPSEREVSHLVNIILAPAPKRLTEQETLQLVEDGAKLIEKARSFLSFKSTQTSSSSCAVNSKVNQS